MILFTHETAAAARLPIDSAGDFTNHWDRRFYEKKIGEIMIEHKTNQEMNKHAATCFDEYLQKYGSRMVDDKGRVSRSYLIKQQRAGDWNNAPPSYINDTSFPPPDNYGIPKFLNSKPNETIGRIKNTLKSFMGLSSNTPKINPKKIAAPKSTGIKTNQ